MQSTIGRRKRQKRGESTTTSALGQRKTGRLKLVLTLGMLLVAGTVVLYSPVRAHDFINYDDDDYVYHNTHVTAGLTWQTIRWSLTATDAANWHPVTWLSHAMDCQLFGLDPGYHHLSSLVIHAFNVLLLFLLLQRATGAVGRSFLVAALFAWHPLNVQSVAWVAERKNLLSTLFSLLTLGAYGWYARKPEFKRLLAVTVVFVLALASKPMAVTLPFVLLLLDYWPLQRVSGWTEISPRLSSPQQPIRRLLLEKVPLFVLSAASCVITIWAQRSGKALRSLEVFPLIARLENAVYSYMVYISKTFWPVKLAVYYPHPGASLPLWKPALSIVFLCLLCATVWSKRSTYPYLIVGWLWFLGTLLPVIGIVQVGDQAMADRYAYIPLIGLFLIAVWGVVDFFDRRNMGASFRWGLALLVSMLVSSWAFHQLDYWQDSVSVWSHAAQVTPVNALAEKQLASALVVRGDDEQAMPHLLNEARFNPNDIPTHVDMGVYYASHRRLEEAREEFEKVVKLTDHAPLDAEEQRFRASSLLDLGFAYALLKDYPRALISFQRADQANSAMVDKTLDAVVRSVTQSPSEEGYIKLSLLLRAKGKDRESSSILEDAIKANPDSADTRDVLNYLSAKRE